MPVAAASEVGDWITAEQLHARFKESIQQPARHPIPSLRLCAELAAQINLCRPIFEYTWAALHGDFIARWRKDQARVAKDARRLLASLKRLLVCWEGDDDDTILMQVTRIVEVFGYRSRITGTDKDVFISCAGMFTPHIVAALRKAGWTEISTTSLEGPVIAVLAMLIGAVTGEEPSRESLRSALTR